jgi:hypothetical protein
VFAVPLTAAGTWRGGIGLQVFTLNLVENNGVVSGTGTITNTNTGTRAVSVTGTFTTPNVNLLLTSGTLQPVQLRGVIGTTINGTVEGSGFSGEQISLVSIPDSR